jgi:hypothetical protein
MSQCQCLDLNYLSDRRIHVHLLLSAPLLRDRLTETHTSILEGTLQHNILLCALHSLSSFAKMHPNKETIRDLRDGFGMCTKLDLTNRINKDL